MDFPADYGLIIRLILKDYKSVYVNDQIATYRTGGATTQFINDYSNDIKNIYYDNYSTFYNFENENQAINIKYKKEIPLDFSKKFQNYALDKYKNLNVEKVLAKLSLLKKQKTDKFTGDYSDVSHIKLHKKEKLISKEKYKNDIKNIFHYNQKAINPKVSVIIVAYNECDDLIRNIDHFQNQTVNDFELIIVDNGLSDQTKKRLKEYPLTHIDLKNNVGPSAGRNIGALHAEAPLLAFIDADGYVNEYYIEAAIDIFEKDKSKIAVRGKVLTIKQSAEMPPMWYDLGNESFSILPITEGNTVMRKGDYIKVGGQEDPLYGHEGIILFYRMIKFYGYNIESFYYDPRLVLYHDIGKKEDLNKKLNDRYKKLEEILFSFYPDLKDYFYKYLRLRTVRKVKDEVINRKDRQIENRDRNLKNRDNWLKDKDKEIKNRDNWLKDKDKEIKNRDKGIKAIKNSKSFKLGSLFFRSVKKPYKLITFPVNFFIIFLFGNKNIKINSIFDIPRLIIKAIIKVKKSVFPNSILKNRFFNKMKYLKLWKIREMIRYYKNEIKKGIKNPYLFFLFFKKISSKIRNIFKRNIRFYYEKNPNIDGFYLKKNDAAYNENLKNRKKVVVVAWSVSHNPVARAFLFYDVLKKDFNVEMMGVLFPFYGKSLWQPLTYLRDFCLYIIDGATFPLLYQRIIKSIKDKDADYIIVCKPKMTSLLLGFLLRRKTNAKIILDVDDDELSFERNKTRIDSISEAEEIFNEESKEFAVAHSQTWNRYTESLACTFEKIIVSNYSLQEKYGGTIIPHIRDEQYFNPKLYNRDKIRKALGYKKDDKVIMFVGTPHKHKGIIEVADALKKIGNINYKFCIIGSVIQEEVKEALKGNKSVKVYENQDFDKLPAFLSAADLVCLLQDINSEISKSQIPSKISDALSMEIPILSTKIKPLEKFISLGCIEVLENISELPKKIDHIFNNYNQFKVSAIKNRKYFIEYLSYEYANKTLKSIFKSECGLVDSKMDKVDSFLNFMEDKCKSDSSSEGIDVVFFWKQNDSNIYGRRSDMMVKYLLKNKKVRKILHFDKPISESQLNQLKKESKFKHSQNSFVFENTTNRIANYSDEKDISRRVYLYDKYSADEYVEYIKNEINNAGINIDRAYFWFCPLIDDSSYIVGKLKPYKVISDVIDYAGSFDEKDNSEVYYAKYEKILKKSNIIFCNNNNMYDYCKKIVTDLNIPIYKFENGCESFNKKEVASWQIPKDMELINKPILGYTGNMDSLRFNFDLLKEVAIKYPNVQIVLIGSFHRAKNDIKKIENIKNIKVIGVRTYAEAIKYIKFFDLCIIPHKFNEMTKNMNPLKLYLYASLNKKILSTNLEGLDIEYDKLYVAKNNNEFINLIPEVLKKDLSRKNNKSYLSEYRWDNIVDNILAKIIK